MTEHGFATKAKDGDVFGTLRLVLAALVAASHVGFSPFGLGVGAASVVVFFMISGHAMSGLETRLGFGAGGNATWHFYLDRLARLYPQYLLWVCLAAIATCFGRWPDFTPPGAQLDARLWLSSLAILPSTFGSVLPFPVPPQLVPQGWSLGTELSFYAVFPILVRRRMVCLATACTSVLVFALASLGAIPTLPYGYVMPFGTFCFFALGHAVFRRDLAMLGAIIGSLVLTAFALMAADRVWTLLNPSVLAGVAVGLPAVIAAERLAVLPRAVDRMLGDASFGTYLSHNVVISVLAAGVGSKRMMVLVPALSALLGWVGAVLIDRPIGSWRRRRRSERATSPVSANRS